MPTVRKQNQAFYEFMVPLVKGYSTEMSIEVASLGVQVHGGMGFIEETGAAQYLRDARILTIYEGTTAIQANDLVGRKTARDGGRTRQGASRRRSPRPRASSARARSAAARSMLKRLTAARAAFEQVVDFVVAQEQGEPERRLRRLGALPDARRQPGGRLADGARAAGRRDASWPRARAIAAFLEAKIATARFYAEHLLSKAPGAARRDRRRRRERHRAAARGVLSVAGPTACSPTESPHAAARRPRNRCPCRSSARRCSSSATRSS